MILRGTITRGSGCGLAYPLARPASCMQPDHALPASSAHYNHLPVESPPQAQRAAGLPKLSAHPVAVMRRYDHRPASHRRHVHQPIAGASAANTGCPAAEG